MTDVDAADLDMDRGLAERKSDSQRMHEAVWAKYEAQRVVSWPLPRWRWALNVVRRKGCPATSGGYHNDRCERAQGHPDWHRCFRGSWLERAK